MLSFPLLPFLIAPVISFLKVINETHQWILLGGLRDVAAVVVAVVVAVGCAAGKLLSFVLKLLRSRMEI